MAQRNRGIVTLGHPFSRTQEVAHVGIGDKAHGASQRGFGTEHIPRLPIVGLPVHMVQIPEVVSL